MPKDYYYHTCCVNSTGPRIREMVDNARDITFKTFSKHCEWREIGEMLGYDSILRRRGLGLSTDFAVSFHKSTHRGRPCYYFCHSAIEYIFTKEG